MKKMNKKLIISILVIFLLLLLSVTSKAWTVPADTAEANNDGGNRWWYSYGYVCREHGAGWHALETPGWSGSNPGEYWGRRTHYIYTYSGSVDYTNNTNVAFAAYAYGHGETLQSIIWGSR